jgi:YVTN family beta-propeller protein
MWPSRNRVRHSITAAIAQNGQRVYVTNLNSNDVSVIDVRSDDVIATITGVERPTTVAIQPKTKDDLAQDANNQINWP